MSNKAFNYIKERRNFFNLSKIEKDCGITRTSLTNAINRNQKSFGQSDLLIPFLNRHFKCWDKSLTPKREN